MAAGPLNRVLQCLRRVVRGPDADAESDADLLARFVASRDETAFATLVRRHGPMVFGVCKRVLGNGHDAEDAFQATFLVLVRKAHAVSNPELLGNWLYGVAHRTALKAKSRAARRRSFEQQVPDMPQPSVEPRDTWNDVGPLLDQALSRLPEKYRVPVVLCDLEGRSRTEAAKILRVPEGTLSSRLATARRMLAEKMSKKGVTLSGGALATLLADQAASAMPASLADSTIQAATLVAAGEATAGVISAEAVALSEEVLKAMFMSKIKIAAAVLLSISILGAGAVTVHALADKPQPVVQEKKPVAADEVKKPAAPADEVKKDKKDAAPGVKGVVISVDGGKLTITIRVPANDGTKQTKDETYTLGKDAKVLLADVLTKGDPLPEGKLTDITEGIGVFLQLDGDKKNVTSVTAFGSSILGQVKSYDATTNTLTVAIKDKNKEQAEKSFTLAKDIKVLLNDGLGNKGDKDASKDQEGKPEDLKEGTLVSLQLSVDQKRVLGIRVQGKTISGNLVGHDAGNNTVTISMKGDGDKTYTLAKNATVVDLTVGARVNLRFSVFDKEKVVLAQGQKDKEQEEQKKEKQ